MTGKARRTVAAALALAVTTPMLSACFEEPSAHEAVRDFLVGWQTGDYAMAARRTDGDQKVVRRALEDAKIHLDAASFRFRLNGLRSVGERTEADFEAEVDLGENNPLWEYAGRLPLQLVDGQWKVHWSPSVIHPQLHEGERFAVDVTPYGRRSILDRTNDPLQQPATLYVATVVPSMLKDPVAVCRQLSKITGFPQDRLLSKIRSAIPNAQVPLVTFGRLKYDQLRARLEAIPGVTTSPEPLLIDPESPAQIVGSVTAVTPESEQQLGGPQRAGDTVGRSGLQKAYQEYLTGSTETRVITLNAKTSKEVTELRKWPPSRSNSEVRTTLDRSIQKAADTALLGDGVPAMLVAVQASTGEVRAVGTTKEYNQERQALAGKFHAGSIFSIMSVEGLLKAKVSFKQKLACPVDRTVGGAQFHQTAAPAGSTLSIQGAFANGCVTALASLARRVDGAELAASAARFGIGSQWSLPLKTFSGKVSQMKNDAATAKAIAGQNVLVSPLSMALVAGAVARGTWRPPVLVTEPRTPDPSAEAAPPKAPDPIDIDPATISTLKSLMRAGVSSGSARSAAAAGDPVYGITASAAQGRKPMAWFVGWQEDVAVAVLAQSSDSTAGAAIAGRFFQGLHTGL
ncbi:penicillin-binding transpeptidase domain-containing protein [Streptosporangium sp. NBC_01639]|uniref:penicillin-binding transpeptidase domain-containing protein n=1 Tax=unclassified Streptosporangium TaxID=2632669 RepID=UPI002DDC5B48|nr:penicillin-binding transpeptidase domain-containing protein [Streptosporangium sp. NBC_01756]WSC83866.1 penicillin-binding transpeptidase domain-containing protein [Streptosporangium sp. NBC_01756]WTD57517.1 penicillin-binding transpeptidase domain-containing protein [Streptosporangium sp. NBC_01639]